MKMYVPKIKESVKKDIKDFVFYHHNYSSSRTKKDYYQALTLIWVDFLEVRFKVRREITPCLKLLLETSNFARKYTRIWSFRKYTF